MHPFIKRPRFYGTYRDKRNGRPSQLGLSFTTLAPHFPATVPGFDNDYELPATGGRARWRSFLADRIHPSSGPCGAQVEHQTGQDCFWLGQPPSRYD